VTDSHLSDGDPFEKELNAHGVKKDFWFIVSKINSILYIYRTQNILEKDYISRMRKMMLK